MRLSVTVGDLAQTKADLVVHFQFAGDPAPVSLVDSRLKSALGKVLLADGFDGKQNSSLLWHGDGDQPARRYLVQGLGEKQAFGGEVLHHAAAVAGAKAVSLRARRVGVALPVGSKAKMDMGHAVEIAAGGFLYGCYRFDKYITTQKRGASPSELILGTQKAEPIQFRKNLAEIKVLDDSLRLARDLVSEHPGFLTPERMGEIAARRAKEAGVACKLVREPELKRMGMGGMLGVARGSEHPALMVHLHHRGAKRSSEGKPSRVVLVGKGVTFDTGGISLKGSDGMEAMKCDMSGSAAVLATLLALPKLGVRHEVHGLLMMVENMPDGKAIRPGDILKIYNGKNVEIKNTDAEGRLILADGLSYACAQLSPDYLVDLATLTGACMVALGPDCTGLMTNEDDFGRRFLDAAKEAGERMWRLPLFSEYREHIRSDVADVKNSGIRYGGAITAGLFLQEFVEPSIPWIHLDIAGPAYHERATGYAFQGATGAGVRTLLRFLRSLS